MLNNLIWIQNKIISKVSKAISNVMNTFLEFENVKIFYFANTNCQRQYLKYTFQILNFKSTYVENILNMYYKSICIFYTTAKCRLCAYWLKKRIIPLRDCRKSLTIRNYSWVQCTLCSRPQVLNLSFAVQLFQFWSRSISAVFENMFEAIMSV